MYGENYGQLWDYKKGTNYDNYNTCSDTKNLSSVNKYWEYDNVFGNHYPYGSYQYVSWQ